MRWGVELWDKFDDVSSYVHKGIEFCEKYEDFCKKRCTIENNYAKHLRKLIETFEPKKKDTEENNSTHIKCFVKMLNELKDIAGQHELVAENIEERITVRLNQLIKSLKEERRKCIDDKEKYSSEHVYSEEQLEKSKQKYERAFKELEKAKELYFKIDNDDHSSKSDIKKQKNICDLKQATLNTCEAEYGKQLCEANKNKSLYYREQLPSVLDSLQNVEIKRINQFKGYICDCVNLEVEVMPRISRCHKEIETAALSIDSNKDTEIPVGMYKTGYSIPNDYVFEDLNEKNTFSNMNSNLNQSTNGSINSSSLANGFLNLVGANHTVSNNNNNNNLNHNNNNHTSRQKKYRTISRLKGIFLLTGVKQENDLYGLPPQQLKKELLKKIENLQSELVKQQKEREGIMKLKDIYTKNQKLGDAQATYHALEMNEEKLQNLTNQLKNYQDIYNEVEQNGNYNNNNNLKQSNHQQHSSSSNEYSSSSISTSVSSTTTTTNGTANKQTNGNGTLTHQNNSNMHIYQSPSQNSVNPSLSPPNSHNSNYAGSIGSPSKQLNNSSGAYAVSPVSQLQAVANNKKAPIVSTTNNESFDDDDDDQYDDGCYEDPSAALKAANLKFQTNISHNNQQQHQNLPKTLTDSSTTATTKSDSFKSNDNNSNEKPSLSQIGGVSSLPENTAGIIYADSQYDHVDSQLYDQNSQQEDTDYDKDSIIGTALVMYAFEGTVQNAMSIQENESLNVLEKDKGDGWTLVKRLNGEKGYVPTDYIRIVYY